MTHSRRIAPDDAQVRRWIPIVIWAAAVLAACVNIRSLIVNAKPLGVDWRTPGGTLLDFRDLVVVPGRYLWRGGNPYDPVPYLAAHPWAQEFDPYSPAWLLISAAIGWLPLHVAALIYLTCMTGVSFLFARLLARWATPGRAHLVAPAIALWFQVWFPARGLGSSFLVIFGIALTLDALRRGRDGSWLAATGLALAVLKPQFGMPLAAGLLCMGHYRTVARGALLALISGMPPLVACIVAAGGPAGFIGSIIRVVRHATSPEAPTGLLATESYRVDLPGLAVRVLGAHPGSVPGIVSVLLFGAVLLLLWLRRPNTDLATVALLPAIYFLPVHLTYDIAIMALVATAAATLAQTKRTWLTGALAGISLLPVLHLHRLTAMVGIPALGADLLDAATVLAALLMAGILVLRNQYSAAPAGSAVEHRAPRLQG